MYLGHANKKMSQISFRISVLCALLFGIAMSAEAQPNAGVPPVSAERLRSIKGTALYRPLGAGAPKPDQVIEVDLSVEPGELALVSVTQSDPQFVKLAIVKKALNGSLPIVNDKGDFASSEHAVWVQPVAFILGGATWDETHRHVVWGEMKLGQRVAVSRDGQREKMAFLSITLKAASAQGAKWSKPVIVGLGSFGAATGEAPLRFSNAALWPESLRQAPASSRNQHALELTFIVDSLVAPDYLGTDRPASDGRYVATFGTQKNGWRLLGEALRKGPYAFSGKWVE